MFTKEFIKISQILDNHGMHRQADDLLKIAQQKKPAAKPAPPTARPVQFMTPSEQNKRLKFFQDKIEEIKKNDNKATIDNLKTTIDNQYKNNYLDYATYNKIINDLKQKSKIVKNFNPDSIVPINPMNPTAFPVNVNEAPMRGRGLKDASGNPILDDDGKPKTLQINLATPVEGLTAAGEKAFPNREDRNLPGLVKEWNNYFETDFFKDSIKARIEEMKKANQDTTQLEELLNKAKSNDLKVGDFGNKRDDMTEGTQIYGVEAKPLTSITGTPTAPAPTAPTPPTPPTGSAATNPNSR